MDVMFGQEKEESYWTAEWQSSFTLDPDAKEIKGSAYVETHYFEGGNFTQQIEQTF